MMVGVNGSSGMERDLGGSTAASVPFPGFCHHRRHIPRIFPTNSGPFQAQTPGAEADDRRW
jgi:hypothetical protein